MSTSNDAVIPVGFVGGPAVQLVLARSGVSYVNTNPSVRNHWRTDHANQFDLSKAEGMMAAVVNDPLRVYQGAKPYTLVFTEHFNEKYYLVIPIKTLPNELWVTTMFTAPKVDFDKRKWVKDGLLYERED